MPSKTRQTRSSCSAKSHACCTGCIVTYKILVWRECPGEFPLLFLTPLPLEQVEDKGSHCRGGEHSKHAVRSKWRSIDLVPDVWRDGGDGTEDLATDIYGGDSPAICR